MLLLLSKEWKGVELWHSPAPPAARAAAAAAAACQPVLERARNSHCPSSQHSPAIEWLAGGGEWPSLAEHLPLRLLANAKRLHLLHLLPLPLLHLLLPLLLLLLLLLLPPLLLLLLLLLPLLHLLLLLLLCRFAIGQQLKPIGE